MTYIDIWNNGNYLSKDCVRNFFGLACSTKVDNHLQQKKGKFGYKGHGSKIFFNAEKIQICSKNRNEQWIVELDNPLRQIEEKNTLHYSDFLDISDDTIRLPDNWDEGFFIRIINPRHFPDKRSQYKLNHIYLRDYILWYTIFGSIQILDDNFPLKDVKLFLHGIDIEGFKNKIEEKIINPDPIISFETISDVEYEIINLGHIFPTIRKTERDMKSYIKTRGEQKNFYDFYASRYEKNITTPEGYKFKLVMSFEGPETKRTYDLLLSKKNAPKELLHTESERYGIWACKGGVPVEKIDNWYEGGKGTYSYMQTFIDCDDFKLTANRGSVQNTEIAIINSIKAAFNNELNNNNSVMAIMNEREDIEAKKKNSTSLKKDQAALKERSNMVKNRKSIILPNGKVLLSPTQKKSGISESETMVLLINIMAHYPDLFDFNILDYDTHSGIDFVIEDKVTHEPKYIELKGTLTSEMNHPFELIDQFICYNTNLFDGQIVTDNQDKNVRVDFNNVTYKSENLDFDGKSYKSCQLIPTNPGDSIKSMRVICLEEILKNVLGASFS